MNALKTLPPTADDLAQIDLAIRSFPNSWGCVGPDGAFRPGVADPTLLWMMIRSSAVEMDTLWRRCGISTDSKSSHADMLTAKEHTVTTIFFKVRRSLFRSAWVGNVSLDFGGGNLYVGSVAGRTQADMWRQLRAFVDGEVHLHASTNAAQDAV
jgi:hypothetical protein